MSGREHWQIAPVFLIWRARAQDSAAAARSRLLDREDVMAQFNAAFVQRRAPALPKPDLAPGGAPSAALPPAGPQRAREPNLAGVVRMHPGAAGGLAARLQQLQADVQLEFQGRAAQSARLAASGGGGYGGDQPEREPGSWGGLEGRSFDGGAAEDAQPRDRPPAAGEGRAAPAQGLPRGGGSRSASVGCLAELEALAAIGTDALVAGAQQSGGVPSTAEGIPGQAALAAADGAASPRNSLVLAPLQASQLHPPNSASPAAAGLHAHRGDAAGVEREGGRDIYSPRRRGALDFADLGSPPLEAAPPDQDGSIVYDLDRPAATPFVRAAPGSFRPAPGAAGATVAGSIAPSGVSDSRAGAGAGHDVMGGQYTYGTADMRQGPRGDGQGGSGSSSDHSGSLSSGRAGAQGPPSGVQSAELGDSRAGGKAGGLSAGQAEGDVGHLKIRAFRPPASPQAATPEARQRKSDVPAAGPGEEDGENRPPVRASPPDSCPAASPPADGHQPGVRQV